MPRQAVAAKMIRSLLALSAVLASSVALAQVGYIPDHERTPGAINPDVTQDNIAQTARMSGFTKTIRPPSSYISRLKARQMREFNLPGIARDYREKTTLCRSALAVTRATRATCGLSRSRESGRRAPRMS